MNIFCLPTDINIWILFLYQRNINCCWYFQIPANTCSR